VEIFTSIQLKNILSYGEEGVALPLTSLNVLIGPNGSGKSNLLQVFGLLQALRGDPSKYLRENGGAAHWGWKREAAASKEMQVRVRLEEEGGAKVEYELDFSEALGSFVIVKESCLSWMDESTAPAFVLRAESERVEVQEEASSAPIQVQRERYSPAQSILNQRVGMKYYPELLRVGDLLARVYLYQDGPSGQVFQAKKAQAMDLPDGFLLEDASNLAMVLLRVYNNPELRNDFLEYVKDVYEGVTDFGVQQLGAGTGQIYLLEGRRLIPASRLSEGTLRYLCLLAMLLDPPSGLVCIEEPEVGLHPDLIHKVAGLLRRASQKAQLIVTTHSTVLVDALSDVPEAVVVCEKEGGQTSLRRLSAEELAPWLEKYSLGTLWSPRSLGGEPMVSPKKSLSVYVEGGGNRNPALAAKCREAFKKLFERQGLAGRLPRVIACGTRRFAYEDFCRALEQGQDCLLLVDSESAVEGRDPWGHVAARQGDQWARPEGASALELHLMVQCMEAWFLADRESLHAYFGAGLRVAALPAHEEVEQVHKEALYQGLRRATQETSKGGLRQGQALF
jgi:predicted ATPase